MLTSLHSFTNHKAVSQLTVDRRNRLRPELAVVDLTARDVGGLEVVRGIRDRNTTTKILVLSERQDKDLVVAVLKAGAHGFLLKGATKDAFLLAAKSLLNGGTYLDHDVLQEIVSIDSNGHGPAGRRGPANLLTSRERQIVGLIAEGKRSKCIAEHLSISIKTVETNRANLMRKLNLHSVAEVTAFAQEGMLLVGLLAELDGLGAGNPAAGREPDPVDRSVPGSYRPDIAA